MNEDPMKRFQEGDEEAFTEIVRSYSSRLFGFIRRFLGDPGEAEDALQETFVRLYRSRETYRPGSRFEPYLFRIAANLCKDRLRRNRPRPGLDPASVVSDRPGPSEQLDSADLMAGLDSALARLPVNQRLVFDLVVREEKSYEETARITGFSLPGVKSLLFRARQSLKKDLGPLLF